VILKEFLEKIKKDNKNYVDNIIEWLIKTENLNGPETRCLHPIPQWDREKVINFLFNSKIEPKRKYKILWLYPGYIFAYDPNDSKSENKELHELSFEEILGLEVPLENFEFESKILSKRKGLMSPLKFEEFLIGLICSIVIKFWKEQKKEVRNEKMVSFTTDGLGNCCRSILET